MIRRLFRGAAVLIVLVAPAVTLAVAGWAIDDAPSELETAVEPILVKATAIQVDDVRAVRVRLEYDDPLVLRSPTWSGLVQEVTVIAGSVVRSGTSLVTIDGISRIALRTSRPLAAALKRGDRGVDVAELQTALLALGISAVEPDGIYGASTVNAVKALQALQGMAIPNGVFDPAFVVWLPADEIAVASLDVTVGAAAPSSGDVIASATPLVSQAEVVASDGGAFVMGVADELLRVGTLDLGALSDVALSPAQRRSLNQAVTAGSVPIRPPETGAPTNRVEVDGSVSLAEPVTRSVLPASAVVGSPDSSVQCIYVLNGAGYSAQAVTVGPADLGTVSVDPAPARDSDVLANPVDVLSDRTCD